MLSKPSKRDSAAWVPFQHLFRRLFLKRYSRITINIGEILAQRNEAEGMAEEKKNGIKKGMAGAVAEAALEKMEEEKVPQNEEGGLKGYDPMDIEDPVENYVPTEYKQDILPGGGGVLVRVKKLKPILQMQSLGLIGFQPGPIHVIPGQIKLGDPDEVKLMEDGGFMVKFHSQKKETDVRIKDVDLLFTGAEQREIISVENISKAVASSEAGIIMKVGGPKLRVEETLMLQVRGNEEEEEKMIRMESSGALVNEQSKVSVAPISDSGQLEKIKSTPLKDMGIETRPEEVRVSQSGTVIGEQKPYPLFDQGQSQKIKGTRLKDVGIQNNPLEETRLREEGKISSSQKVGPSPSQKIGPSPNKLPAGGEVELPERNKSAAADVKRYEDQIQDLQKKITELEGIITSIKRTGLATEEDYQKQINLLKSELAKMKGSYENALQEKEGSIRKLNNEISDLKKTVEDLEKRLLEAENGKTVIAVAKESTDKVAVVDIDGKLKMFSPTSVRRLLEAIAKYSNFMFTYDDKAGVVDISKLIDDAGLLNLNPGYVRPPNLESIGDLIGQMFYEIGKENFTELKILGQQLHELQKNNSELQKTKADLAKELDELIKEHNYLKSSSTKMETDYRQKIKDLETELQKLRLPISYEEAKNNPDEVKRFSSSIGKSPFVLAEEMLRGLALQNEELVILARLLETVDFGKDDTLKSFLNQLKSMDNAFWASKSEILQLKADLGEQQNKIPLISDFKVLEEEYQGSINKLEETLKRLQDEKKDMQSMESVLLEKIRQLEAMQSSYANQIVEMEATIKALEKNNQDEGERLRAENDRNLEVYKKEVGAEKLKLVQLQQEIYNNGQEIQKLTDVISKLKAELEIAKNNEEDIRKELITLKGQYDQAVTKFEKDFQVVVSALSNPWSEEAIQTIKKHVLDYGGVTKITANIVETIEKNYTEFLSKKNEIAMLKEQINQLKTDIQLRDQNYANLQRSHLKDEESLKSEFNLQLLAKQAELDSLRRELSGIHSVELKALAERLTNEKTLEINQMSQNYEQELARLKAQYDQNYNQQLLNFQAQTDQMERIVNEKELQLQAALKQLESLQSLELNLKLEFKEILDQVEQKHNQIIANLNQQYEANLQVLKDHHQKEIETITGKFSQKSDEQQLMLNKLTERTNELQLQYNLILQKQQATELNLSQNQDALKLRSLEVVELNRLLEVLKEKLEQGNERETSMMAEKQQLMETLNSQLVIQSSNAPVIADLYTELQKKDSQILKLQENIRELNNAVKALEGANTQLENQVQTFNNERMQLNQQYSQQKLELEALNLKYQQDLTMEKQLLETRLQGLRDEKTDIQKTLDSRISEIEGMKKKVGEQEKRISELEGTIQIKDNFIVKMTDDQSTVAQRTNANNAKFLSKISRLENQIKKIEEDANTHIDSLLAKFKRSEASSSTIPEDVQKLIFKDKVEVLGKEIDDILDRFKGSEAKVVSLNANNTALKQSLEKTQNDLKTLQNIKEIYQRTEESVSKNEKIIKELQQTIDDQKRQLEEQTTTLKNLKDSDVYLNKQNTELEKKVKLQEDELAKYRDAEAGLKKEIKSMAQQLANKAKEIDSLNQTLDDKQRIIVEIQNTIKVERQKMDENRAAELYAFQKAAEEKQKLLEEQRKNLEKEKFDLIEATSLLNSQIEEYANLTEINELRIFELQKIITELTRQSHDIGIAEQSELDKELKIKALDLLNDMRNLYGLEHAKWMENLQSLASAMVTSFVNLLAQIIELKAEIIEIHNINAFSLTDMMSMLANNITPLTVSDSACPVTGFASNQYVIVDPIFQRRNDLTDTTGELIKYYTTGIKPPENANDYSKLDQWMEARSSIIGKKYHSLVILEKQKELSDVKKKEALKKRMGDEMRKLFQVKLTTASQEEEDQARMDKIEEEKIAEDYDSFLKEIRKYDESVINSYVQIGADENDIARRMSDMVTHDWYTPIVELAMSA